MMMVFDSEEDVVRLANDSEYGLAASISTWDVDRLLRVAREIEAGSIWINDWGVSLDEFEQGGFKRCGNGRLNGQAGINDFLEYKHIAFNPASSVPRLAVRRILDQTQTKPLGEQWRLVSLSTAGSRKGRP